MQCAFAVAEEMMWCATVRLKTLYGEGDHVRKRRKGRMGKKRCLLIRMPTQVLLTSVESFVKGAWTNYTCDTYTKGQLEYLKTT